MSHFDILKAKILNFFPPVNINISDVYEETARSYSMYSSNIPLKYLISDQVYAPEILKTLQTLRILLRSNIDNNRFIYEINLLNMSWGKGGFYSKSIIKQELIDLIIKISKVFMDEEYKKQLKLEQEKDMIKYANEVTMDYISDNLNNMFNATTISKNNIKKKLISKRKREIKNNLDNLDFNKLKIKN